MQIDLRQITQDDLDYIFNSGQALYTPAVLGLPALYMMASVNEGYYDIYNADGSPFQLDLTFAEVMFAIRGEQWEVVNSVNFVTQERFRRDDRVIAKYDLPANTSYPDGIRAGEVGTVNRIEDYLIYVVWDSYPNYPTYFTTGDNLEVAMNRSRNSLKRKRRVTRRIVAGGQRKVTRNIEGIYQVNADLVWDQANNTYSQKGEKIEVVARKSLKPWGYGITSEIDRWSNQKDWDVVEVKLEADNYQLLKFVNGEVFDGWLANGDISRVESRSRKVTRLIDNRLVTVNQGQYQGMSGTNMGSPTAYGGVDEVYVYLPDIGQTVTIEASMLSPLDLSTNPPLLVNDEVELLSDFTTFHTGLNYKAGDRGKLIHVTPDSNYVAVQFHNNPYLPAQTIPKELLIPVRSIPARNRTQRILTAAKRRFQQRKAKRYMDFGGSNPWVVRISDELSGEDAGNIVLRSGLPTLYQAVEGLEGVFNSMKAAALTEIVTIDGVDPSNISFSGGWRGDGNSTTTYYDYALGFKFIRLGWFHYTNNLTGEDYGYTVFNVGVHTDNPDLPLRSFPRRGMGSQLLPAQRNVLILDGGDMFYKAAMELGGYVIEEWQTGTIPNGYLSYTLVDSNTYPDVESLESAMSSLGSDWQLMDFNYYNDVWVEQWLGA